MPVRSIGELTCAETCTSLPLDPMNRNRTLVGILAAGFLMTPSLWSDPKAPRPKILGVAHVAFFVSDLGKTRAFYKDFLGFEEPFALKKDDGTDRIAFIKINDR